MFAMEITKFGGPEVLQLCTRPLPKCGNNEVLIKVHAAGVNRSDVLQRQGYYFTSSYTNIPGLEIAGEIIKGDLVNSEFNIGDQVCALVQGDGYAEYCVAPISQCLPIPFGLSMEQAAALPETFFTVWSNVFDRAHLSENEILFVQGGSSGIGVTAIQLGVAYGHRVFVTAGTDKKCLACEKLGAELSINYRTSDFEKLIKTATNGRGVDVILDIVAGDYLAREVKMLANDGRLIVIALLGGATAQLNFGRILRRGLTITGSTLRSRSIEFKAGIARQLRQKVWPLFLTKQIQPIIYQIFPLKKAAQAHILMESNEHIGKIILTLD